MDLSNCLEIIDSNINSSCITKNETTKNEEMQTCSLKRTLNKSVELEVSPAYK